MTVFPEDDEPELQIVCKLCGRPVSDQNVCPAGCDPLPAPSGEPWGLDSDGE